MDIIEKRQLYAEALQAFKNNEMERAFSMFDSLGGYKDSYTYLGSLAMKKYGEGITLDFVNNALTIARKKGDHKAFMLTAGLAASTSDEIKAKRYGLLAVDGLETQAADGDFYAAYLLAQYYSYKDIQGKAFFHAFKSAQSGFHAAQYLLSQMYSEGRGTAADDAKAVAYLEKAAFLNYGEAQYALGFRYSKGRGVPQDDDMALKLYQMAASSGISGAAYNLALWYERAYDYVSFFK